MKAHSFMRIEIIGHNDREYTQSSSPSCPAAVRHYRLPAHLMANVQLHPKPQTPEPAQMQL